MRPSSGQAVPTMRPVTLTGPYVKGEKPGGPQNKHSREIVIGSIMNYESRPLLACQFKKITEGFIFRFFGRGATRGFFVFLRSILAKSSNFSSPPFMHYASASLRASEWLPLIVRPLDRFRLSD